MRTAQRLVGFVAASALAASASFAGMAGAGERGDAAAKPKKFDVQVLGTSQDAALRANKLKARVQSPSRARVSLPAPRVGNTPVAKARSMRFTKPGSRLIGLPLTDAGRRELARCASQRLDVRARARTAKGAARKSASRKRSDRDTEILRPDSDACRSGGSGNGGSGGSGGGSSGPGGSTGADASLTDRCDFLDESVCLYPWPNDHFTKSDSSTDTGRRLSVNPLSMPESRQHVRINPTDYNLNDGFSPGSPIITKVPGLNGPQAFSNTGAVPIEDIGRYADPDQPVVVLDTDTGQRHPIWSEVDANPSDPDDVTLIIRPAVNFKEGHRYIVALRDLKDASNNTIEAGQNFKYFRDDVSTNDPAVEGRRAHLDSIFNTLQGAGIQRGDLFLAWDFTVGSEKSLSQRMLHIRDDAFAKLGDTNLADRKIQGTAPNFSVDEVKNLPPCSAGSTSACESGESDRIAREVEGKFDVPCYLAGGATCAAGSRFVIGPDGNPVHPPAVSNFSARYSCRIPRSTVDGGPNPARGSLYGHGLLGSRGEINQDQLKNFGSEHNVVFCATDWIGMACADLDVPNQQTPGQVLNDIVGGNPPNLPECDLPNVAAILQDLSNFPSLADRVQQGMLNFLYLGRLMAHSQGFNSDPAFQVGGEGVFKMSPDPADTRIFYDGNSQGGIIGGSLISVAPDLDRGVIGVNGMNYSTLLRRSVDFDRYATGEFVEGIDTPAGLYDNYPNELERPLILSLMQQLWDRAEADGYAHHMTSDPYPNTPPHAVLEHPAFGDHQVANVAAEVQARTIGAKIYQPALDPGRHWGQIYGLAPIPSFPYAGSAIVYWDSGPCRELPDQLDPIPPANCIFDLPSPLPDRKSQHGTPTPPTEELPPRQGNDPHEFPRRQAAARQQKSDFFNGGMTNPCKTGGGADRPCYTDGWDGN